MEGFQCSDRKYQIEQRDFGVNLIVFVTSKAPEYTFLHCTFRSRISQKHFQRACFVISVDNLEAFIPHTASVAFNSPSVYPMVLFRSLTSQVFQLILLVSFTCIQGSLHSSGPYIVGTGKDSSGFCLLLSESGWAPTEQEHHKCKAEDKDMDRVYCFHYYIIS